VGDIFHYQEESAGRYSLAGKKGHVSLRFLRNVGGLKVRGTYPYEFYTADNKRPIQEVRKIEFTDIPYLHLTHLSRSSQDAKIKEKAEIGISFPLDFYYPEVFFGEKPNLVPSPWKRLGGRNLIKAALATPPRKIKRRIF
jgi:hypothetical protein